jgi:hypothetical protein
MPCHGRFGPGRGGLTDDDAKAWAGDLANLGDEYFFSVNRYVLLTHK